ncbi:MAG TPA: F0F1 ATP synthase subunit A [Thermoleophilaceae bacterium]|nr:F0F1 ATP synthase subunit A [Thermoleophilaceae bacterium]
MSVKRMLLIGFGVYIGGAILLFALFGSEGENEEFQPQEEFRLEPWIELKIGGLDMSINRAVFYLFLACALTAGAMVYVARRMQQRPNKVQTAVETLYNLTYNTITRGNMSESMSKKWFPFVATLFFFIWISNLIGYIPLPTNTHETVNIFGIEFPSFAIYAATANLSIPLVLTLIVWFSYQVEGVRAKGFVPYVKSWIPRGTPKAMRPFLLVIEIISQTVRIISLSVRLFANILAGHLLILFMGGGLGVILGLAVLGWLTFPLALVFFIFEVVLVATLQAFIFATLTSIYFGEATSAEGH